MWKLQLAQSFNLFPCKVFHKSRRVRLLGIPSLLDLFLSLLFQSQERIRVATGRRSISPWNGVAAGKVTQGDDELQQGSTFLFEVYFSPQGPRERGQYRRREKKLPWLEVVCTCGLQRRFWKAWVLRSWAWELCGSSCDGSGARGLLRRGLSHAKARATKMRAHLEVPRSGFMLSSAFFILWLLANYLNALSLNSLSPSEDCILQIKLDNICEST